MRAAATAIVEGADRVERLGGTRGVDEDPVGLGGGADAGPRCGHGVARCRPAGAGRRRLRAPPRAGSGSGRPARTPTRCELHSNVRRARWVGVGRQVCCAFVGREGGGVPAATLRSGPDELEGGGQLVVRAVGGGGAMPGLPVGVPHAGQGRRPAPGAHAACPDPWRPGRSPTAPAGGVRLRPTRPRRGVPTPRRSPAHARPGRGSPLRRLRTATSPVSSAAATNKNA